MCFQFMNRVFFYYGEVRLGRLAAWVRYNRPCVFGNGQHLLGFMSQFGIMLHLGLCRIRGYVVQHNVTSGIMSHSDLCRLGLCPWAYSNVVRHNVVRCNVIRPTVSLHALSPHCFSKKVDRILGNF